MLSILSLSSFSSFSSFHFLPTPLLLTRLFDSVPYIENSQSHLVCEDECYALHFDNNTLVHGSFNQIVVRDMHTLKPVCFYILPHYLPFLSPHRFSSIVSFYLLLISLLPLVHSISLHLRPISLSPLPSSPSLIHMQVHTFIGHGNMVKGICRNNDTIVTASWLQTKVPTKEKREAKREDEN